MEVMRRSPSKQPVTSTALFSRDERERTGGQQPITEQYCQQLTNQRPVLSAADQSEASIK